MFGHASWHQACRALLDTVEVQNVVSHSNSCAVLWCQVIVLSHLLMMQAGAATTRAAMEARVATVARVAMEAAATRGSG